MVIRNCVDSSICRVAVHRYRYPVRGAHLFSAVVAASAAVGVILDIERFVHDGGCGVGFFVGGDFSFVLERRADIVEALQENFLP